MKKYIKLMAFVLFGFMTFGFWQSNSDIVQCKEVTELTIELLGDETIYLIPNSEYVEYGAKAYDPVQGDISDQIVIDASSINNSVESTYQVSYTITNELEETKIIYRNVIVEDFIFEKNSKITYDYTGVENTWKKVIETSDGNILAVGHTKRSYYSYNSYTNAYIAKFDKNLSLLWEKAFSYSPTYSSVYDYGYDCIEHKGNYIVVSVYQSSSITYISMYNSNGEKIYTISFSGTYKYIKQISTEEYIIHSDNGDAVKFNAETKDYSKITLEYGSGTYDGWVENNKVYFLSSSNKLVYYDIAEEKSVVVKDVEYSAIYGDGYKYAYKKNEYIVRLNDDFEEIDKLEVNVLYCDSSENVEFISCLLNDNTYVNVSKENFEEVYTYNSKVEGFSGISGIALLSDGQLVVYGKDGMYCYIKKIHFLNAFANFSSEEFDLNETIDYFAMIKILDKNLFWHIDNIEYSHIDSSKAGIYTVYFTVKYLDENILTIQATKQIMINYDTSLEDGASYSGEVLIDIKGASITISEISYEYGDTYNIPGWANIIISGENDYKKILTVFIEPIISGLEDGAIYYDSVSSSISGGTILLDGQEVATQLNISDKGNHTLIISNGIGYEVKNNSQYPFKYDGRIYESTNKQGSADSTMTFEFESAGEFSFYYWISSERYDYLNVYFNNKNIVSISGLTSKKLHTISVTEGDVLKIVYSHDSSGYDGDDAAYFFPVDSYSKSIHFTIEPTITGVADGETYITTLSPIINAENMTLNGASYNNEVIDNCGNYELIILGVGGYTKTINFVIDTIVEGVIDEAEYEASVTPHFTKGTATLNGQEYVSGTTITIPGYSTLIIEGEGNYKVEYNFTIVETIEGVENAEVYVGNVTPIISGGILSLNGNEYISSTTIDVPGNYTLEINGVGSYYKKILFIVKPEKINVINGETYFYSLIPAVSKGTLTLNDMPYTSGEILNESGSYTLKVVGEGGYLEIINFNMQSGANVENDKSYVNEVELKFVGTALLNGETVAAGTIINEVGNYILELSDGETQYTYNFVIEPDYSIFDLEIINEFQFNYINAVVKVNDVEYISNAIINEVGKYELQVEGINGYHKEINFDIDPYSNVKNEDEYIDFIEVDVNGGNITLDGEAYEEKTLIDDIGNHSIHIEGLNGYYKIINFVIHPSIYNVENSGYYFEEIEPQINSENITLDGEEYILGDKITKTGAHSIIITGVNGYEKVINFVILPNDFSIKPNEYYIESVLVNYDGVSIEIDEIEYINNQEITAYGEHKIRLNYKDTYSEYTFFIIPLVDGVVEGAVYANSVIINTDYTYLLLDNNPYTSGDEINEIGNHVFVLKYLNGYDHFINFTIKETFVGVEDDGIYQENVIPSVSNGTLLLDGESFTSGSEIKTVGHHVLTIIGVNGYQNSVNFTILENSGTLVDDGEYEGSIKIQISNANLQLDGKNFTSGTTVNTVGYHTLTVYGIGDYEAVYSFLILPKVTFKTNGNTVEFEEGKIYENVSSYIQISVSNVQSILLNGEGYSSNSNIYNVGNHNVKIYGINDYVYEMNFTKAAYFTGVSDGGEYTSYTTINCSYVQNIEFNGDTFTSGTRVHTIGNHVLKFYGVNNYEKEIRFTIKPYFYSDSTYMSASGGQKESTTGVKFRLYNSYSGQNLATSYYQKMEIDGETYPNTSSYYYIGNHKLIVYGTGGYEFEIEFVITPTIYNLVDGKQAKAFTPTIYLNNTTSYYDEKRYVLLDGESYQLNTQIQEVGNHTLTIYGSNDYIREFNITILPAVTDLTNNSTYEAVVTPKIEYSSLLLNGDEYLSGTEIVEVGNHTITILGVNNYSEEYSFTITPANVSKYKNKTFAKELTIEDIPNCTIFINGQEYTLGDKILSIGNNVLDIYGINGYQYQLNFTLTESPILQTEDGNITFANNFTADRMVRMYIPHADLLIDGTEYNSGDEYTIVGKHYLTIKGLNGYSKEYEFTIKDKVYGLTDAGSYDDFTIICDDVQRMVLNTDEIENGHSVNKVGSYRLTVYGTNGYVKTYSFTIKLKTSNIKKNMIYNEPITPTFNSDDLTLDGEKYISGTTITKVGNHSIVVNGTGAYTDTFTFTIKETITGIEDNGTYSNLTNVTIEGDCKEIILNSNQVSNSFVAKDIGYNYLTIRGTNNYEKTYSFTIEPVISGVENGETYYESLTISTLGECEGIKLNDNIVSNIYMVDSFGNYSYEISGINNYKKVISFTVIPTITGISNNGEYNGYTNVMINLYPKTIKLNGTNISLDSIVNKNFKVSSVGYNKLSIESMTGELLEIPFTINPILENFENGKTYVGSVTPNIKGDVVDYKLNGKSITVNSLIDSVGYNTLTITGVNDYESTYTFTLKVELLNTPSQPLISFDPIFNGDGEVYLNGQLFASSTKTIPTVDVTGRNVLVVKGNNDYSESYTITIAPIVTGVAANDVKSQFTIDVITDGRIYLDGIVAENSIKEFSEIGNHTLSIEGVNNYIYQIDFTVRENYSIQEVYEDYFILDYIYGKVLIDGNAYLPNSAYTKIGNHTLTILGSNGYSNEYDICIEPIIAGKTESNKYINNANFSILIGNNIIVDGVEYTNHVFVDKVGNHTLIIGGSNGYSYSYNFVILESTTLENKIYYDEVSIIIDGMYSTLKLDGKNISNNYICKELGNHELVIEGTNGYVSTYLFKIHPTITGIENNGIYENGVSWEIGGSATVTIDGDGHSQNESYFVVGNHIMRITTNRGYEKVIQFTILPVVDGVEDGGVYDTSVVISITNSSLELDGKTINYGHKVTSVGYHELIISGANKYKQVIRFTITEKTPSFKNNAEYDSVYLTGFENCELFVDGVKINNNSHVSEPGKHILIVKGQNGYAKEYSFIIKFNMRKVDNIIATNGGKIYVNDEEVQQYYAINSVGYNTVKMVGTNGYTEEARILVTDNIGISHGEEYINRVLIKKINARVFIDDVEIFEDTYIEKSGEHRIKIIGVGDYQRTIDIKIINTNITYAIVGSSIVMIGLIGYVMLLIRRKRVI